MGYKFANINGVRMHYDVQGEGPALLLIHAGIANLDMWDDQMPAFTKHFRVIRHDVRGFGETPDPAGSYTDHDDIHELLDLLGISRVSIVGISNGGRIAIDYVVTFPNQVDKLVLVAPGLGGFKAPSDPWAEEKYAGVEVAKKNGDMSLADELTAQIWVDGPRRIADQVDAKFRTRALELIRNTNALGIGDGVGDIARPPAAGQLAEIKAPTLLIIGDQDVDSMFPVADAIVGGIPGARRVNMEDTAHLPPMEKPEEFNKLVLDFLLEG